MKLSPHSAATAPARSVFPHPSPSSVPRDVRHQVPRDSGCGGNDHGGNRHDGKVTAAKVTAAMIAAATVAEQLPVHVHVHAMYTSCTRDSPGGPKSSRPEGRRKGDASYRAAKRAGISKVSFSTRRTWYHQQGHAVDEDNENIIRTGDGMVA